MLGEAMKWVSGLGWRSCGWGEQGWMTGWGGGGFPIGGGREGVVRRSEIRKVWDGGGGIGGGNDGAADAVRKEQDMRLFLVRD